MFALRSPFSTVNTAAVFSRRATTSLRAALSTSTTGTTTTDDGTQNAPLTVGDFLKVGNDSATGPPIGGNYPRLRQRDTSFRATPLSPFKAEVVREKLRYRVHCRASRNNTMVHVTEPQGRTVAWFSGGSLHFKGINRASYEAGYQCAVRAIQTIQEIVREKGDVQLELYLRGFGQGRDAMKAALLAAEGESIRHLWSTIQDRTPIKIGGTRAPKARRL